MMQTPPPESQKDPQSSGQEPLLEMKDIVLSFGKKKVLDNLNLKLYPHQTMAILGPSGGGKSTIIKILSGLLEPDQGEVIMKDKSLALAFQEGALFTSLTVAENIEIVLKHASHWEDATSRNNKKKREDLPQGRKNRGQKIKQRINEVLELVGLEKSLNAYPHELSGGMQKRVGIARALAIQPDIILYDEPFSGLDPILISHLSKDLQKIHQELNMTGLVVTHEFDSIQNMAQTVGLLYEGKFVYEGSVDDFLKTDNEFAKQFREHQEEGPIKV